MRKGRSQGGFTIPELIVIIAIISLLGIISLFLLRTDNKDVVRRNAERQTDLALIAQGVGNYYRSANSLPAGITTQTKTIGTDTGQVDLCKILVPKYITDLPLDPQFGQVAVVGACDASGQEYVSGYTIERSSDSRSVTLRAPNAEGGLMITLTKQLQ